MKIEDAINFCNNYCLIRLRCEVFKQDSGKLDLRDYEYWDITVLSGMQDTIDGICDFLAGEQWNDILTQRNIMPAHQEIYVLLKIETYADEHGSEWYWQVEGVKTNHVFNSKEDREKADCLPF